MKPHARDTNIVLKNLGNELLIYDLENDKAFCLNETSAAIWRKSNGKRTVAQIASLAASDIGQALPDEVALLGLQILRRRNLLQESSAGVDFRAPIPRREILQKIGISSTVALPIVSSIVAPRASYAQSNACPASPCRCPNASSSCNGSTSGPFVNCFTVSGGIGNCDCNGPFDVPDSGGAGFKVSLSGCSLS